MIILHPDKDSVVLWLHELAEPLRESPERCVQIIRQASAEVPIIQIHPVGGNFTDHVCVSLESFTPERLRLTIPLLPEWNEISCRVADEIVSAFSTRNILVAFDDFLFQKLPESARKYALPSQFQEDKYMKHGFDGLAHKWAVMQNPGNGPLITIHLAEQTTVCGFMDGKITATSTGYSPVDGLLGEKTCGKIDPSLAMMLADKIGVDAAQDLLVNNCGWQTLSPSLDIQHDTLAGQIIINELLKSIGAMAAHSGGLERIFLFGENESSIEQISVKLLHHLSGEENYASQVRFLSHALPTGKMYAELLGNLLNNE